MKRLNWRTWGVVALVGLLGGAWLGPAQPAEAAASARLELWTLPAAGAQPSGLDFDSVEGQIYVAAPGAGAIARVDPRTNLVTLWPVGGAPQDVALARAWDHPRLILPLPELYFTEGPGHALGRLAPLGGQVAFETLPAPAGFPHRLAVGEASRERVDLWFSERAGNRLGRFAAGPLDFGAWRPAFPSSRFVAPTADGVGGTTAPVARERAPGNPLLPPAAVLAPETAWGSSSRWDLSGAFSGGPIEGLALGRDGSLWSANGSAGFLAQLDPATDTALLHNLPAGGTATDVALDAGGFVWFAAGASRIGRLDPNTGDVLQWALPAGGRVLRLAPAPDGRVWFTARGGDRIGVLDPVADAITAYPLPAGTEPLDLTLDGAGAVWFTAEGGGAVGRLAPEAAGAVSRSEVSRAGLSIALSAGAARLCNPDLSHELRVNWRVDGGTPPHEIALTLTGPDGQTETVQTAELAGEHAFALDAPAGGAARVEVRAREAGGAEASGTIAVALAPCAQERSSRLRVWFGEGTDNAQITLRLGQILELVLDANPATGFTWELSAFDPAILQPLGAPAFSPESDAPGAPGVLRFRFEAVGAGETPLELVYRRPWEEGVPPADTFTAQVTVVPDAP